VTESFEEVNTMRAEIKRELTVHFSLPGVSWGTRSCSHKDNSFQLERDGDTEQWYIKVNESNVRETAARLRELADELERFSTQSPHSW